MVGKTDELILVVDDNATIRSSLSAVLSDEGFEVSAVADAAQTFEFLEKNVPAVILLDIWLPGMSGMEVLERVRISHPEATVIMISGHGTIDLSVQAMKLGAYGFIEKPLSLENVLQQIQHALESRTQSIQIRALKQRISRKYELIGKSPSIEMIREQARQAAPSNGRVLIMGENGTGKELVAGMIHGMSLRKDGPFVEVNCAAIPGELIESELFGHEKGAFTGATRQRIGKFQLADGGTLFLDEVGDMSLMTQAKVLRALEEQRFERVGGSKQISVDVRVISASNKNLRSLIEAGKFRDDLYYRLNVIPIVVPPLKERLVDIPLLANYFAEQFCQEYGKKALHFRDEAIQLLQSYTWPGNVRELKNIVERVVIMSGGDTIAASDVFDLVQKPTGRVTKSMPLKEARQEFEKEYIVYHLQRNEWNVNKTAQELMIDRTSLYKKMRIYRIVLPAAV
ncbi:MAG: sigma-54-dependent Fis family transcriptional regulator [Candidatus Coatesbacteria bacterium]|nr:sigma-54-dependent Fis family transcriptional regulator [Candidatus Coatesbacteria bacterium]